MENGASRFATAGRRAFALAVLVAALAITPAAVGHAILLATNPGNDSVLDQGPSQVTLRFNEPVESAFGSLRVYDSQARRVDDGHVVRPDEKTVAVSIERRLPRGTCTVTWRVVSADAHPVSGAFVFHVEAPGANPAGIAAQVLEGGTPRTVSVTFTAVRFLDFAFLLLVLGGAAALAYPLRTASRSLRRALLAALAAAGLLLGLAAVAGIVLQGTAAGGLGLSEAARWDGVTAVLETRFGKVWLVQAALAVAVALLALAARRVPARPASACSSWPRRSCRPRRYRGTRA
jgi:copper transport protein